MAERGQTIAAITSSVRVKYIDCESTNSSQSVSANFRRVKWADKSYAPNWRDVYGEGNLQLGGELRVFSGNWAFVGLRESFEVVMLKCRRGNLLIPMASHLFLVFHDKCAWSLLKGIYVKNLAFKCNSVLTPVLMGGGISNPVQSNTIRTITRRRYQ